MKNPLTLIISFLIFCFFLLPGNVLAANFTVDSTTDAVDANIGNGTCASAANECTLRAAIQEANAAAGPHVITVPAGSYKLTLAGPGEDVAATGDLDILQEVTITGAGEDLTIVDGQSFDRVFNTVANVSVTLEDLSVRNGSLFFSSGDGGGILTSVLGPQLTLTNVSFIGNFADDGGAVQHLGPITITNSTFNGNLASNQSGGGVLVINASSINISGSTFKNNHAGSMINGVGGAFSAVNSSNITITDSTFQSNSSDQIAGCAFLQAVSTSVQISNSQFLDCRAGVVDDSGAGPNGIAGGIYILANTASITDSTIQWNSATRQIGGALLQVGDTLDITGSNFNMNGAGGGTSVTDALGAGAFIQLVATKTTITDSNFQSNTAIGSGTSMNTVGGLFLDTPGELELTNVLIDKNTAFGAYGGAYIKNVSKITASELVVSNNNAQVGASGGLTLEPNVVADITINNSKFDSNSGFGVGGGLILVQGVDAIVSNSTFSNNNANGPFAGGGGVYIAGGITNGVTFSNSTFSNNWAGAAGGGVLTTVTTTLNNSTFAYNGSGSSTGGDSLYNGGGGTVTVSNSVLANGLSGLNCFGTITSGNYNIDDDGSCGFAESNDLMTDPMLDVLADNGGPVYTHNLLTGSPAIDSANDATCESTDARGYSRPQDGDLNGTSVCDRGAVELIFDCNNNNVNDINDISAGTSADCDSNSIPDECQNDADSDGTIDACEDCDNDPDKTTPGFCGCGSPEVDANGNGVIDCDATSEVLALAKSARKKAKKIKYMQSNTKKKGNKAVKAAKEVVAFVQDNSGSFNLTSGTTDADLLKKAKQFRKAVKKLKKEALTGSQSDYDAAKKKMNRAYKKFKKLLVT